MRAIIPAMALCAVLQANAAVQTTQQVTPAANQPTQGALQAQLVTASTDKVVVAQHVGGHAPAGASLNPAVTAAQPASGEEHRPTTAAMLLAAVVLMTGIALRRWGAGEQ